MKQEAETCNMPEYCELSRHSSAVKALNVEILIRWSWPPEEPSVCTCSIPQQHFFGTLSLARSPKHYLNSQTSPLLKLAE